jgi:hypothetical protein
MPELAKYGSYGVAIAVIAFACIKEGPTSRFALIIGALALVLIFGNEAFNEYLDNAKFEAGKTEGAKEYQASPDSQQALNAKFEAGKTEGAKEYMASPDNQNALKAQFDTGKTAGQSKAAQELAKVRAQLGDANGKNSNLEHQIASLSDDLGLMNQQLDKLRKSNGESAQRLAALNEELNRGQDTVNELTLQGNLLHGQLTATQKQFVELQKSSEQEITFGREVDRFYPQLRPLLEHKDESVNLNVNGRIVVGKRKPCSNQQGDCVLFTDLWVRRPRDGQWVPVSSCYGGGSPGCDVCDMAPHFCRDQGGNTGQCVNGVSYGDESYGLFDLSDDCRKGNRCGIASKIECFGMSN